MTTEGTSGSTSRATLPAVLLCLAILVTSGGGYLYGRIVQRWGVPVDLAAAGQHLRTMPEQLGDWHLEAEETMEESVVEMLACAGYVNRVYRNQKTGATVQLAIVLGPPGTISVHTPEICYSSRDYPIASPKQAASIDHDDEQHSFWHLDFESNDLGADGLRVYYAWDGTGSWVASDSPRFEFVGKKMLYKLQLAAHISTFAQETTSDPCRDFLQAMIASDWSIWPPNRATM